MVDRAGDGGRGRPPWRGWSQAEDLRAWAAWEVHIAAGRIGERAAPPLADGAQLGRGGEEPERG